MTHDARYISLPSRSRPERIRLGPGQGRLIRRWAQEQQSRIAPSACRSGQRVGPDRTKNGRNAQLLKLHDGPQPFDLRTLEMQGGAIPVLDGVRVNTRSSSSSSPQRSVVRNPNSEVGCAFLKVTHSPLSLRTS